MYKSWKYSILMMILMSSLFLVSCQTDARNSVPDATKTQEDSTVKQDETSSKDETETQVPEDPEVIKEETVETISTNFINRISAAIVDNQPDTSFEEFISNENLLQYTRRFIELSAKETKNGALVYSKENSIKTINHNQIAEQIFIVNIEFEFQHLENIGEVTVGHHCELLIVKRDDQYRIVDYYFGNPVDAYAMGLKKSHHVSSPERWNDEDFVQTVFQNLDQFEASQNK